MTLFCAAIRRDSNIIILIFVFKLVKKFKADGTFKDLKATGSSPSEHPRMLPRFKSQSTRVRPDPCNGRVKNLESL